MTTIFNPKSKTHWVSTATAILGGLMTFLPTVMQFIPVEMYGPIFVLLGVAFHVLRNLTTKPIDEK
jgi:hypothetical protein